MQKFFSLQLSINISLFKYINTMNISEYKLPDFKHVFHASYFFFAKQRPINFALLSKIRVLTVCG